MSPTRDRPSLGEQVLANSQAGREVVQDFVPLAQSLEWELGQQYLRERGNKAFISDASPVPFVINNDGNLSRNAAELFFASLNEADNLEADIFVLELGIGVGLFARFFLDHFKELCKTHKKDYYERLCYIAADKSPRMLMDVLRHGIFANHPGRYRVRQVDAMEPDKLLPDDLMFAEVCTRSVQSTLPEEDASRTRSVRATRGRIFRAVFLNYLLDCLPAAPLDFKEGVKHLCVRTCVARNVKLEDYTDMSVEAMKQRAQSEEGKRELLDGAENKGDAALF